ncbi:MAG: ABC transporter permease [Cyclobacteriaceae bacterium]|nr:ABC transporter permease [Cyclobacteriaceae bacterium]
MIAIVPAFKSEWIKKKGSLSVWLVFIGAVFTPVITLLIAIKNRDKLPVQYAAETFWKMYWNQCWQPMSFMLLPLGIVLATSLLAQLEFKNNTWKQVHASPQTLTTIFFSKFAVQLTMLIQLFLLFNLFVYLSAYVPPILFSEVPFPKTGVPWSELMQYNLKIFIGCMPIVALQFLLSIQFKNFLVPVGTGIFLWLLSTLVLSWEYAYLLPYLYPAFDQLTSQGALVEETPDIHRLAIGYSIAFLTLAYILYIRKADKG